MTYNTRNDEKSVDCGVLVFVDVRVENEWWLSEFLLYTSSLIGGFSPKEILFASYFQKGSWKIKGRDRKQIDRHEDVRLLFSKRKLQIVNYHKSYNHKMTNK